MPLPFGRGFQGDLIHKLMSHSMDGEEKAGQDFFLTFRKFDGGAIWIGAQRHPAIDPPGGSLPSSPLLSIEG